MRAVGELTGVGNRIGVVVIVAVAASAASAACAAVAIVVWGVASDNETALSNATHRLWVRVCVWQLLVGTLNKRKGNWAARRESFRTSERCCREAKVFLCQQI